MLKSPSIDFQNKNLNLTEHSKESKESKVHAHHHSNTNTHTDSVHPNTNINSNSVKSKVSWVGSPKVVELSFFGQEQDPHIENLDNNFN